MKPGPQSSFPVPHISMAPWLPASFVCSFLFLYMGSSLCPHLQKGLNTFSNRAIPNQTWHQRDFLHLSQSDQYPLSGAVRSPECQSCTERLNCTWVLNYNHLRIYFYLKTWSSIYQNEITLQSESSFLTRFICFLTLKQPLRSAEHSYVTLNNTQILWAKDSDPEMAPR